MNEEDFEGTLILESLARIDRIEEFMAAIDSENLEVAAALMKSAGINNETITVTLKKIMDPCDEN